MRTATTDPLPAGTTFGSYRIEGVLGIGGMGVVYEATQLSLNRRVAIKVLRAELGGDAAFGERFRREQVVMASLDHPNVLPIYEAGEVDDSVFLAMRLVSGGTLKDLITQGPLEPQRAAHIVVQAAHALDAAHEAGIVHRDVKPQNILIDENDHAYLSDFGLVRVGSAPSGMTMAGEFVGTLDYVAPEQIRGEAATALADVYGLGCVLFEALTGVPPFVRDTDVAILFAHVTDPPPVPSVQRPGLAPAFDTVVARALAKDPADRYPTAGALGDDALAAADGLPLGLIAPSPAPRLGAAAPAPVAAPSESYPMPTVQPTSSVTVTGYATPQGVPPPPPPAAAPPWPASARRGRLRLPSLSWRRKRREPQPATWAGTPPVAPPPPTPWPPPRAPMPAGGLRFALKPGFSYVHQPLADDSDGIPLLGNEDVVGALKERIVHSSGGSFLVTGFRGVGKTTVIARALSELAAVDEPPAIVPVTLNVARPRTVEQLLFEIIRRVFETLKDEDLLDRMDARVQRELLLAYARTSLSFNETRSKTTERGGGMTLGLPTLIEALAPKFELSRKSTNALATQASFLAYTDADVEHDFMRIVSLVERASGSAPNAARNGWRGKLLVVIDELDKLTVDADGRKCIYDLLSGMKNLLTARGVHFLFVAGPDLHDVALRESRRGNSVYESVFAWQLYVPCLWRATDRLLDALLDVPSADAPRLQPLRDYLRFKSRGVPRLLLRELNDFVRWDADGAYLEVAGPDRARVEFYAELEQVVAAYVHRGADARPYALAIDEDRWRLGAYYLVDWILQSEGAAFTVAELVDAESERGIDALFSLSSAKVEDFLEHLVANGMVTRSGGHDPRATYYGDAPEAQEAIYRLSQSAQATLGDFARVNERERADLELTGPGHQPWAESGVGERVDNGRFELVEELDRGGLGRVYRARDRRSNQEVAVKLFEGGALQDGGVMRARFARKADIARGLDHPNIVRTHHAFEEDKRLGVVMDLVDGTSLRQVLQRVTPTASEAVRITLPLADALDYVHARGIARLDLKPSSILVREGFDPLVLDVGLAKRVGGELGGPVPEVTTTHAILGTPAYAAPEQLRAEEADIRSDIYALGLILYEMLSGHRARQGGFSAVLSQGPDPIELSGLDVSADLREVLARMLAPDPDARFPDPGALRDALARTPEATGA